MFYNIQKEPLKITGNFDKTTTNNFLKKSSRLMVKLNFEYNFINWGEILNKMTMVKKVSTQTQIAYFPSQFMMGPNK